MSSSYCIIALLFCFLIFTPVSADLKVHFLDVNEGDAVLLQADGQNMLIDAGTTGSGNLTKHYLKSLKISEFDQVLVTSPEEGRTGGLTNILNDTPARHYSDGGWNVSDGTYRDVITKLDEDQIPRTKVLAGSDIQFAEGVNITIVSPANLTGEAGADTLVPLITYGNTRFLLMGSETGMFIITPTPETPLKPGSATHTYYGVTAEIVDANGQTVADGEEGFLVLTRPWPAMLRTIYGDPDRYVNQYWSTYPDKYMTGD